MATTKRACRSTPAKPVQPTFAPVVPPVTLAAAAAAVTMAAASAAVSIAAASVWTKAAASAATSSIMAAAATISGAPTEQSKATAIPEDILVVARLLGILC